MKMQKHWYLGFLGLIGVYKFPSVLDFFQGFGQWWELLNLLWFIWFLYFIPEGEKDEN